MGKLVCYAHQKTAMLSSRSMIVLVLVVSVTASSRMKWKRLQQAGGAAKFEAQKARDLVKIKELVLEIAEIKAKLKAGREQGPYIRFATTLLVGGIPEEQLEATIRHNQQKHANKLQALVISCEEKIREVNRLRALYK